MAASRMTKAQIEERLAELEAENASLREQLDARPEPAPAPTDEPTPASSTSTDTKPSRGRAFLATTLIVLGAILAPLGTVASYGANAVSDTDAFVSTLAPLAEDPAIQALVVDQVATAIDDALDPDALVADLLDSIIDEDSTPRLAEAGDVLGPLLADQTRTAIRAGLTSVVESDAFAAVWEQTLTLTHEQVVAILEGEGDGAVAIDTNGNVVIQMQPIIDVIRPALVDQGFTLAQSIPDSDATVTVTQVPEVATARLAYAVLTTLGSVLPWLTIALLVIGIALHPRRPRALVIAGTLMLVVGSLIAGLLMVVGAVAAAALASDIPVDATIAIYDGLTASLTASSLGFALAGLIALIGGVLAGRSRAAEAARAMGATTLGRGATSLEGRGWRSPELARLLERHGWLQWVALAVVFAMCFALLRPVSPGDVLLTAILLALVAVAFGVLRGDAPATEPAQESNPAIDPV
ncbi:hypothetical protein [Demequina salsinemoris]|uniref:hypothetical protein n=1 Tax=Demequina salsinemoris TaxID=577470 RepID=UPI0007824984|nr:hypothetical protein [Demequina salsinemoris]